ncbi:MAG TPA: gamma-glutamylcyclotransferase [Rhabdochlamydiaceae bacterium]|nr:gamma-glutamylcyclotransferase [Rhabdochlamydiaceae bacterium]
MSQNEYFFFSYGLYMNAQFVQKDLRYFPHKLGVYKLDGYEFSYSRAPIDKNATGGNIQPKTGKTVYGVVWKLKEKDFSILDKEEHAPIAYTRMRLKVVNAQDPKNFKWAEVYVANPEYVSTTCFPRPWYVEKVTRGAKENGFPEDYIKTYLEWSGPWGEN